MALNRQAVLNKIYEYDKLGESEFLKKYAPRGRARSRFLFHEGKFYNMKAIWRAAHAGQVPDNDHSDDAQRELEHLGFMCVKDFGQLNLDFESELETAIKRQPELRKKRLALASTKPEQIMVRTAVFLRNPDVVAEVLAIANGKCGACQKPAPFHTKTGRAYLEVHHKIQLAEGGEDSVDNAIALCPNCHRKAHYGDPGMIFSASD